MAPPLPLLLPPLLVEPPALIAKEEPLEDSALYRNNLSEIEEQKAMHEVAVNKISGDLKEMFNDFVRVGGGKVTTINETVLRDVVEEWFNYMYDYCSKHDDPDLYHTIAVWVRLISKLKPIPILGGHKQINEIFALFAGFNSIGIHGISQGVSVDLVSLLYDDCPEPPEIAHILKTLHLFRNALAPEG